MLHPEAKKLFYTFLYNFTLQYNFMHLIRLCLIMKYSVLSTVKGVPDHALHYPNNTCCHFHLRNALMMRMLFLISYHFLSTV